MKCPLCKRTNPDNTICCDCGLNSSHPDESILCESQGIVNSPTVPLESIIKFIIKLCIASIPLFIIFALISVILYAIFGGFIGKLVELIK